MQFSSIRSITDFQQTYASLLQEMTAGLGDDYYSRNKGGEVLTLASHPPITFDSTADDGMPFIQHHSSDFAYIVSDRGNRIRESRGTAEEILEIVFGGIAFTLASNYELRHRSPFEDSRRQLFAKKIELLAKLDAQWAANEVKKVDEILTRSPFVDRRPSP